MDDDFNTWQSSHHIYRFHMQLKLLGTCISTFELINHSRQCRFSSLIRFIQELDNIDIVQLWKHMANSNLSFKFELYSRQAQWSNFRKAEFFNIWWNSDNKYRFHLQLKSLETCLGWWNNYWCIGKWIPTNVSKKLEIRLDGLLGL
jgi:hypothetical protein